MVLLLVFLLLLLVLQALLVLRTTGEQSGHCLMLQ
jgi:hypothetical protein